MRKPALDLTSEEKEEFIKVFGDYERKYGYWR
jgi:hypothetical protein